MRDASRGAALVPASYGHGESQGRGRNRAWIERAKEIRRERNGRRHPGAEVRRDAGDIHFFTDHRRHVQNTARRSMSC
jgi:hypothetical protein